MKYTRNKYHAHKCTIDGQTFDSKKEAMRYTLLKEKAENGQIKSLQRQVKFTLIPEQREPDTIGPRGGVKKGKVLERECSYIADFVYLEKNPEAITGWTTVVEDTKGFRTTDYKIKRKLMLYMNGIRIREI